MPGVDDDAPPTAHWRHDADARLLPVVSGSVVAFAADRGLSAERQQHLARALDWLLEPAPRQTGSLVVVDAATDGDWLAVRVRYEGVAAAEASAHRAAACALRVESGAGDSVLMELAMR